MSFIQPITIQSIFGQKRIIGSIAVQVIISEETSDVLSITRQPVQTGASITDHAYKEPTVLNMRILQQDNDLVSGILSTFSGNGLAAIYKQFLDLQSTLVPFNVITPKRVYSTMLISSLRLTTDKNTENILALDVGLQQIILVTIGAATIATINQKNKKVTQATQSLGQKSALQQIDSATGGLVTSVGRFFGFVR